MPWYNSNSGFEKDFSNWDLILLTLPLLSNSTRDAEEDHFRDLQRVFLLLCEKESVLRFATG